MNSPENQPLERSGATEYGRHLVSVEIFTINMVMELSLDRLTVLRANVESAATVDGQHPHVVLRLCIQKTGNGAATGLAQLETIAMESRKDGSVPAPSVRTA